MRTASQLIFRGIILFVIGTSFTLALNLLQNRQNAATFHSDLKSKTHSSRWWLSLICGFASALVGLIYPCLEYKICDQHVRSQEWSHVLRCIAMFVGISEACNKIDFPSNLQLSLSLAVLSLGLWWYFDRTTIGLILGITIAALATFITQILVYHQVCECTEREFLYMRSWLPCVVFSGGITMGNIGKQLAINDFNEESKAHTE